jgi:hypothetical protein
VIEVLAGIVEQRAGVRALDHLLERGVFELAALDQVVEVVVGGVMLAVMEVESFDRDMWRQGVYRIGQLGSSKASSGTFLIFLFG